MLEKVFSGFKRFKNKFVFSLSVVFSLILSSPAFAQLDSTPIVAALDSGTQTVLLVSAGVVLLVAGVVGVVTIINLFKKS